MAEEIHSKKDGLACSCICCDRLRSQAIKVGSLVVPITRGTSQGFSQTPYWRLGKWKISGWSLRFENDFGYFLVVESIDKSDADNGGHLDSVVLFSKTMGVVVTSSSWLEVIA